jgi:hypothetical protein|tara:strand:- start:26 stop:997 length:972 start_codon:yes stop_codon:yes gene_type:complete
MSKPTLLLSFGFGWAASSPFAYTLQRYTKYCHTGFTKELKIIQQIISKPPLYDELQSRLGYIKERVVSSTWENYQTDIGHKMNLPEDLAPLRDFPLQVFEDLTTPPYTLDKYINYYYNVWEHVKHFGYKAVADHSKFHQYQLSDLVPIIKTLHEHFHLKSYIIVRDPVRRAFSEYLAKLYLSQLSYTLPTGESFTQRASLPSSPTELGVDYITYFDQVKQLIPDSQMFVMEELWEGSQKEKNKLSSFLDTPVQKLWKNCYAPDRGHLVPFDPSAPCQYDGQHLEELTGAKYKILKQSLQSHYDNWTGRYGILPRYWGRPLKYL